MLSLNPGLKDITHSITGGAIAAQGEADQLSCFPRMLTASGYWMPYECAKAVCATFCYNIAGALIPIFGPSFPSMCIPPGCPDYQRMVIDHRIVEDAIREADLSRKIQQHHAYSSDVPPHLPPVIDHRPMRPLRDDRRLRLNTRLMSPYSDTEGETNRACPDSASSSGSDGIGYSYGYHAPPPRHALPPTSGWTPANRPEPHRLVDEGYHSPHPYLSAVPRFTPLNRSMAPSRSHWTHKRPMEHDDSDGGRDSRESTHGSSPAPSYVSEQRREEESDAELAEQNAALGLMTLKAAPRKEPEYMSGVDGNDTHRSKRRRATSA